MGTEKGYSRNGRKTRLLVPIELRCRLVDQLRNDGDFFVARGAGNVERAEEQRLVLREKDIGLELGLANHGILCAEAGLHAGKGRLEPQAVEDRPAGRLRLAGRCG